MVLPLEMDWRNLYWAGLIFVLTYGAIFFLLGMLLVRLPSNYFCEPAQSNFPIRGYEGCWTLRMVKNLTGGVLIILGGIVALPGIPGPGLLILLLGIMLADFRGKRRFEQWLVRRPGVLITINTIRGWFDKAPIFLGSDPFHPLPKERGGPDGMFGV